MLVLSVSIHVKPEHVAEFIPATLANARGSRGELGNLRYDVLRDEEDPNHFLLYEVYRDAEALEAHGQTPHYKAWSAAVGPWMIAPRTRVRAQALFLGDEVL